MKNFKEFSKVLLLFILGFLTIIPNAEVWNFAAVGQTDVFHIVVSVLDFLGEGALIYFFAKKVLFKKEQ